MAIQVCINRQQTGTLTISQSGLYTVLEAAAPNADGLVRLWVHGNGKSAYLGVMEPKDGGLYLRRRLSRRELAAFPDPIEFASDQEQTEKESKHNTVDIKNNSEQRPTAVDEMKPVSTDVCHEEPVSMNACHAEPEADRQPKGETDMRSCPWPAEVPEGELLWYRRPDGSLVSFDGVSNLLAIPAKIRKPDARMTERVIEGKKYLVFRT